MAFARVEDLEARWRPLSTDEATRAGTLLDDAGAMLAAMVTVDEDDASQAALLKIVSCSMVMRSMLSSDADAYGVSQLDYGMGPFSQAVHYANPNGDMYLTAQERKLLGIGECYVLGVRPLIDGAYGTNAEG